MRVRRWLAALLVGTSTLSVALPALAVDPPRKAEKSVPRPPMSPLPKPPKLTATPPDAASLEALDELLSRISSKDAAEREAAAKEILDVDETALPAIHRRLTTIAESGDRVAMKEVLGGIRDDARAALKKKLRAAGKKGKVVTPDYLEMLLDRAKPENGVWQDLVRVVAMSRMLGQIGTVQATRELVYVYTRYGEFLRVDTQVQLERLGDRSLAALIEAQRHPAEKIARWARRQLDLRGKAIPSETVQTDDYEVLADILRAYGRIRDPDAARLVISFSNSERAQIREASRQAVAMLGEVGNWQLRDTYEKIAGKRPPREWSWERTARELFTEFDRLRLAQVYQLFEDGLAAYREERLDDMAAAFDKVLTRNPMFEHGDKMVSGYLDHARANLDHDREKAMRALRRAHRLAPEGDRAVESLLMTLEAEDLLERGVADQVLLRRSLDLDPENARAQELLDRVQRGDVERETRFNRYLAASAIGLVALLALALILLRRPKPPREATS